MRAKDALGRYGEDVASRYLTEAGLVVLERNWRCPAGEIDIVARDGGALVVCEVKTRRNDLFGGPYAGITPAKLQRLRRLAATYVRALGVHVPEIRVDVVAVWASGRGAARVEHLRGVQ
ncbi:YraN family protein [Sporichthya polymorpha]|uniref:YraN family protein n=1 Tax=Sporichthya polymorpha TaxID=35751 RepID=UPI0003A36897|nr:YraN family protein [Sporichthya polymorpha]